MLSKMLNMIPDALAKSKESNFGKVFVILSNELEKAKQAAEKIEEWRDIDLAEGKTLDQIGNDYEQHRGQDGDSLYRFMIKSKIEQSQSNGTFNELINVICRTINCQPEDVNIVAGRFYDALGNYAGEPLAIEIKSVPMRFFVDSGIKVSAFIDSVRSSAAAGVRIISISIEYITNVEIQHKRTLYRITYDGFAGDGSLTGETPGVNTVGAYGSTNIELNQLSKGFVMQNPLTGEAPFQNTLAAFSINEIEMNQDSDGFVFNSSPEGLTGEVPFQNTLTDVNKNQAVPEIETKSYAYEVSFSGEDDF